MADSLFERQTVSSFSEFVRILRLSGLLTEPQLEKLLREFHAEQYLRDDVEKIHAAATYLTDSRELTRWQVEKLLMGKHRGFIQSHYLIRQHVGVDETTSFYIALDLETETLVKIGIQIDKKGSILVKEY